jgi:hypothetical protein
VTRYRSPMAKTYEPSACPACAKPLATGCGCSLAERMAAVRNRHEGTAGRGKRRRSRTAT